VGPVREVEISENQWTDARMTTDDLIAALFPREGDKELTPDQLAVLRHPDGPAWVMAGPGSGKTEVLALLVLRLLFVEDEHVQTTRVDPGAIVVTTFTEKAARNLQDRINSHRTKLAESYPEVLEVDISKLKVDTLHGLCNDLLQKHRAPNYQNVRLMDEFEQALFVHEHVSMVRQESASNQLAFWKEFAWMFLPHEWQSHYNRPPNRWKATHALVKLVNRLVEDRVSLKGLAAKGPQCKRLTEIFEEYQLHLNNNYRCDFSQLQRRFFEFLGTQIGERVTNGDADADEPGVKWVLVDEYQDTNPIQEAIYFKLLGAGYQNLVVVGDDDQALYRFRGGSVECMVTFDEACEVYWGMDAAKVGQYPLVDNFRSHTEIVDILNEYIRSFPIMQEEGARAEKPEIRARRIIEEDYPAAARLVGQTLNDAAEKFAGLVQGLVDREVVKDPSDCCLLLTSTKETPGCALRYVEKLREQGLEVHNPRNKTFVEQEEVKAVLGGVLALVDPDRRFEYAHQGRSVPAGVGVFRDAFADLMTWNESLREYVEKNNNIVADAAGEWLDSNLQQIVYYLLSFAPFATWLEDPTRRRRIGRITDLMEGFSSMPVLDPDSGGPRLNVNRGSLKASAEHPGEIDSYWLGSFYYLFLGYVVNAGFNDYEDPDVVVPKGAVPIMTIHQAKGLEFPFVFVGDLGKSPSVGSTYNMEELFADVPENPDRVFERSSPDRRAKMDLIRQYYVAYSRPQYGLILIGSNSQYSGTKVPLGPEKGWMAQRTRKL